MRVKTSTAVAFTILLVDCASAQVGHALTHIDEVKQLAAGEANKHLPVVLRGVVTQIVPEWWGFSLQDATGGVYVAVGRPLPQDLEIGHSVEVSGQTFAGNFAPVVRAVAIRSFGAASMPLPKHVDWQSFATGSCDNQYVEVQGVVRSTGLVEPPAWEWRAKALRVDVGGNLVWAYLRINQNLTDELLVDSNVRVRGVCLVFSNSQRQYQGTALTISRRSDVEVLRPGPQDQFDAPLQIIPHLFAFHPGTASFHRVRILGAATLQVQGGVYVQQGSSGILVRAASLPRITPGDQVEAVGFPVAGGFSTVLDDSLLRVIGHGPDPTPRDMAADQVFARVANAPAAPNGVLVRVPGRVLDRAISAQGATVILADGHSTFTARLRLRAGMLAPLEPGTHVVVTGVCSVQVDDRGLPQSFELLMRSPGDVHLVQAPPWLSRGVAIKVAGALLAFLAVSIVSLLLLRRTVERQTAIIRAQFDREAALQQRYSDLVENASDLVYIRDLEGKLLQVNRFAVELTGYTRQELLTMNVLDLLVPDERERARAELGFRTGSELSSTAPEWRFLTKDGAEVLIETKQRFLVDNNGPARVECIGRDITARKRAELDAVSERNRLEEQLHHSQKMESIGQLAGGVAHDFNNMLTVISGYAAMTLEALPEGHPLRDSIIEITGAAARAAALTRQLLLFSRRQTTTPKIISVNDLVIDLQKMLRRLIGENIRLVLALEAQRALIHADPGHIEQVVMNLVLNARDAVSDGGEIVIRTADFYADAEYAKQHLGIAVGKYLTLCVTDTGVGIPPEIQSRIFEPFFTTKEPGKGTGLGLSMVYGIVRQSGGAIFVDSAPGRGTTFEILLPSAEEPAHAAPERALYAPVLSGHETILVSEDEPGVRNFVRDVLSSQGYTVLESANGREALMIAADRSRPLHLLVTDVVMPEMGGVLLAQNFSSLYPDTPVLFMSGYNDQLPESLVRNHLLRKPFTPAALLERVRAVLMSNAEKSITRPD